MESDLLESFREEFQCFSREELEEAVREAKLNIKEELERYQIYQTQQIVAKPKRVVNVGRFQNIPIDHSEEEEETASVSEDSLLSESVAEVTSPNLRTNKSRLSYSLDQLEKIFSDIFKSINVNKNYVAKDCLEKERAMKRVKDFTSRFGRTLYQTKQNYISLKNIVLRSELSGSSLPANLSDRLAQLFVSCRPLLSSYLHFLPLSGGNLFPAILSDALHLLLDIGNLTVSTGFSTDNLARNVRHLEELMTESGGPDVIKLQILNNLAKSTFGETGGTKARARKSPRKATSSHSTIKPRSNKIFQQRTNMARQRRMKDIAERNSDLTVATTERQVEDRRMLKDQLQSCKAAESPSQMKSILRRIHNLEVVASTDTAGTETRAVQHSSKDLDFLINRLEIIESDFEMIALKYRDELKPKPKSNFSTKFNLDDVKYFNSPIRQRNDTDVVERENSRIAQDQIEAIVHKITDEILSDDLLLT